MKAFLRSDGVQAVLGWLLGAYLRVVLRTVRWRHENLACVEPVLADDTTGAIALFESLGFKAEALLHDQVRDLAGKTHDIVMLGHNVSKVRAQLEAYGVPEAVG